MLNTRNKHLRDREKLLADSVKEIAAELRLVDVVDYVAFLRMEKFGNIADVVESSTQLYMKSGTLCFANDGTVNLTWNTLPSVDLEMRFGHDGVTIHFRLGLSATKASVHIVYMDFQPDDPDPEANTAHLARALDAARIKPLG